MIPKYISHKICIKNNAQLAQKYHVEKNENGKMKKMGKMVKIKELEF